MANAATVDDSTKIIGLCGAGAKIAQVELSIDANAHLTEPNGSQRLEREIRKNSHVFMMWEFFYFFLQNASFLRRSPYIFVA